MDIQDLRVFSRVAAIQNLSAVGTELALTPGTISKRIQALEEELGARLFDRTTRSIRITEEGAKFLEHVERILGELENARASVSDNLMRPKGKLKIAAPESLGRRCVAPAICAFMRSYPEIDVHIDLSDRTVNLQEDGYDVAIRTGVLADSTLIAKRLGADLQVIVGAPQYLAKHGEPRTPQDLGQHNCMVLGDAWHWSFERQGADTCVRVAGRLRANSSGLLLDAARGGHGLIRTSERRVRDDLAQGSLVRVLGEYNVMANSAIWAVYPGTRHVLPRLRVLLDFFADWFREVRGDLGAIPGTRVAAAETAAAFNGKPRQGVPRPATA